MTDSIVPKTLIEVFRVTCLSALCLGAALAAAMAPAGAQHLDPPLGWDIWDPTWSTREIWKGEQADETVR
jgi:hypothetical protein